MSKIVAIQRTSLSSLRSWNPITKFLFIALGSISILLTAAFFFFVFVDGQTFPKNGFALYLATASSLLTSLYISFAVFNWKKAAEIEILEAETA